MNHHYVFELFLSIMQIVFLLQDTGSFLFLRLGLLRELFVFHELGYILKYKPGQFVILKEVTQKFHQQLHLHYHKT